MALPPPPNVEDRQYLNLLGHLRRSSSTLPLSTLESAIPYYLSRLDVQHVAPLTGAILGSAFWLPVTSSSTSILSRIYRNTVHLKYNALEEGRKSVIISLSRPVKSQLNSWVNAVLTGCSSGDLYLRSSIYGGILQGLSDIKNSDRSAVSSSSSAENEVVIAMAELLEKAHTRSSWNLEYKPPSALTDSNLELLLIADYLLLVREEKWKALNLLHLFECILNGITQVFDGGNFLRALPRRASLTEPYHVPFDSEASTLVNSLRELPLYTRIPALSRILSRSCNVLVDHRPRLLDQALQYASQSLEKLSIAIELAWESCPLASIFSDDQIDTDTQPLTTSIWSILKTFLFATVMVDHSILMALLYFPRSSEPPNFASPVATSILKTIYHLSFIVSKVGGVSAASEFAELKKCFYLAVDCCCLQPKACQHLIATLCTDMAVAQSRVQSSSLQHSRAAVALICVEQFMPVLDDALLESHVLPVCVPLLDQTDNRELYESAHSVMLSMFGSHAQKRENGVIAVSEGRPDQNLVSRVIPFYCNSLIENAKDDKLNTEQLRTAYCNLVRSATQSGSINGELAWLCVDRLLSEFRQTSEASNREHRDRVLSTLISLLPALPSRQMVMLAKELEAAIKEMSTEEMKELALDAIRKEIVEGVGDNEKDFCLKWWDHVVADLKLTTAVVA